jgi:hypothetical protein
VTRSPDETNHRKEEQEKRMDPLSRAAALAIVFGLLALFVWAVKRPPGGWMLPFPGRRAASAAAPLRAEASLLLSPQHRLHIVCWEHRRFLVLTGAGAAVIHDLETPSSFLPAFAASLGSAQESPREQA